MRIQRIRWCLWGAGSVLYAAVAFLLAWAVFWPTEHAPRPDLTATNQAPADIADPPLRRLDPQQFAALLNKRLRALLDNSNPQSPPEVRPSQAEMPDAVLGLTLRGTIVEKGHSVAVFSTVDSPVEIRGIGERVGDPGNEAEIVEVQRDQVVLRYQGDLVTLPFPDSEEP